MPAPRLLHVFQNFDAGGIQMRTVALINALGARYHHTILPLGGAVSAAQGFAAAAPVELQRDHALRGNPIKRIAGFRQLIRDLAPDLLLTYNWGTIEVALANQLFGRRPHIHHEAGFGIEEAARRFRRRNWFRQIALRRADLVLVPSRTLYAIACREWGVAAHCRYLPDGIDIARFSEAQPDYRHLGGRRLVGETLIVGTVAPLRPEKRLDRFLKLIKRLRDSRVDVMAMLVGSGSERASLEKLAVRLGIAQHVVFTGFIADIETVYPLFDVFAITSETEQLPNALLQAMAAGNPVVGTAVGDIPEMVAPENHPYIVDREDETALARGCLTLLAEEKLRVQIGNANRREVEARYGLAQMVAAYDACFKEALA